jgi:Protein of unknown function (DUF4245)
MTGIGPSGQQPSESLDGAGATPVGTAVPPAAAADRASRLNAANMLRSLLPLVVIVLLIVGWQAFKDNGVDPVHTIDPSSTERLAAAQASYDLLVPTGLPSGYRPTSARTDAADARKGDPVTLQIGYVTPSEEFAGFAESDDPRADALTSVLAGARPRGSVEIAGRSWARFTTQRGETALTLRSGRVTVVVTGSASGKELETVAGAVRTYSP